MKDLYKELGDAEKGMEKSGETKFPVLQEIFAESKPPAYIKLGTFNKEALQNLNDGAFGYPDRRLFPLHTPADTWMSARYFEKTAEAIPEWDRRLVQDRIDSRCRFFQVDEISIVEKKAAAIELSDDDFCFVKEAGSNTYRNFYVGNKESVEESNNIFGQTYTRFSPRDRCEIASALMEKCAQHEVTPHRETIIYSGMEKHAFEFIEDSLQTRKHIVRRHENADMLKQAYSLFLGQVGRGEVDDITATFILEGIDKRAGLDKEWDLTIPDPFRTMYKGTITKHALKIAERDFEDDTLRGLGTEFYGNVLGDTFAERISDGGEVSITKLATALQELSEAERKVLEQHIPA